MRKMRTHYFHDAYPVLHYSFWISNPRTPTMFHESSSHQRGVVLRLNACLALRHFALEAIQVLTWDNCLNELFVEKGGRSYSAHFLHGRHPPSEEGLHLQHSLRVSFRG